VGTNVLFPPVPPEDSLPADSLATEVTEGEEGPRLPGESSDTAGGATVLPGVTPAEREPAVEAPLESAAERTVVVETPLYRYAFSTRGATLRSAELSTFPSLRGEGPVQLLPEGGDALGQRLVVRTDTVDLSSVTFEVTPAEGLRLEAGGAPRSLTFTYDHPGSDFLFEVEYFFHPDSYVIDARGRVRGVDRPLLVTDLGSGLAFTEADSASEARMMAYVANHVGQGIRSQLLSKVDRARTEDGPYVWAAFRSKFFVLALLAGDESGREDYLGGLLVGPDPAPHRASVAVTQAVGSGGEFDYRLFLGPQEYAALSSLGADMEEVNPYGWRFFRPIIRPIVSIIIGVLTFLHGTLNWGYGWVLILFGVLMRVLLWPLNQKAMRAQMRNMAVQPLVKELQSKYKDNPEKMQKEMMRLYKEYGFNPLAGCLPMLLPWPVLIALFFVFQNTIEFRGVPFLWLPDLSAPDPFYLLPIFLAVSMFLMQYISYKSMDQNNPQMKMMMWFFPIFFGFLFMQFAAGLNLYYAVSNVATIPQQYWIAKERKKAQAKGPVKLSDRK